MNRTLLTFTLAALVGLTNVAHGQEPAMFFVPREAGIQQTYGEGATAKLVVARALAEAHSIELQGEGGRTYSALRQKVEVINPPPATPNILHIVSVGARTIENRLPVGKRVLLVYLEPKDGTVLLNISKTAAVASDDVAAQAAVLTLAVRPAQGANFRERLFSSLLEAVASLDFPAMLALSRLLPMPPGYDFSIPTTGDRKLSEFLKQQSVAVNGRGGIFSVAFQSKLSYWAFRDATPYFLDALLANLNDARIEDILAEGPVSVGIADLYGTTYSPLEADGHERLLHGAQNARSDRAAAIFASLINRPLREETKLAYVSLLKRDMPHLRARVCNDLARRTDKRDRIVPDTKDVDGWEARVAAMAQLWLREYGLEG